MNSELAKQRLEAVRALASPCHLCPRRCGVDRMAGDIGWCGAGPQAEFFLEYVQWAEDLDIAPTQSIYLSGCNLSCHYCQTADETRQLTLFPLTPDAFHDIVARGWENGARTVNITGGEPIIHLPALFEIFADMGDFSGLVWSTNLFGTADAYELLDGVVDIFVADIKFASTDCASKLSGSASAGLVARARAREIFARSPDSLIVRHLVVPGHFLCCTKPTLEWIGQNLPGVKVSLKTGFLPPAGAWSAVENRFLTRSEVKAARELALELGLRLTKEASNTVSEDMADDTGGMDDNNDGEDEEPEELEVEVEQVIRKSSGAMEGEENTPPAPHRDDDEAQ